MPYVTETEFLGMPYMEASLFWYILGVVAVFFIMIPAAIREIKAEKRKCDLLELEEKIKKLEAKDETPA